jgi:hypothetical protein
MFFERDLGIIAAWMAELISSLLPDRQTHIVPAFSIAQPDSDTLHLRQTHLIS